MVYFWTGRRSHGYAVIREIKGDHILLDPEPDAVKGSHATTNYWAPRDRGVLKHQVDTPPQFWYTIFQS